MTVDRIQGYHVYWTPEDAGLEGNAAGTAAGARKDGTCLIALIRLRTHSCCLSIAGSSRSACKCSLLALLESTQKDPEDPRQSTKYKRILSLDPEIPCKVPHDDQSSLLCGQVRTRARSQV